VVEIATDEAGAASQGSNPARRAMTRECSGCGLMHCQGECFHESDPDAVEFAQNMKLLREKYGNPFGTECAPDPLPHLEPKKRAA
jgi:hypothetical protein